MMEILQYFTIHLREDSSYDIHWGVMEGDGTMIEQNSLCLVTDWDIFLFFFFIYFFNW